MTLYAVTREAGPGWAEGRGAFEQPGVGEHSAFMNALAGEGFVVLAGPLAGSERDRIRVLLIAEAASEGETRRRLADDPWERARTVVTRSVEPWVLFVGEPSVPLQPAAS